MISRFTFNVHKAVINDVESDINFKVSIRRTRMMYNQNIIIKSLMPIEQILFIQKSFCTVFKMFYYIHIYILYYILIFFYFNLWKN